MRPGLRVLPTGTDPASVGRYQLAVLVALGLVAGAGEGMVLASSLEPIEALYLLISP